MFEVSDPVCGSSFLWDDAQGIYRYRGQLYYFCCKECRTKFTRSPGSYIDREDPLLGDNHA